MNVQVITIATEYFTAAIDLEDVEKMLRITRFPERISSYPMLYVTLVVLHEERWPEEVYEIDGNLYVTLLLSPAEIFGNDVSVVTKDRLRSLLETAQIEKREMEVA